MAARKRMRRDPKPQHLELCEGCLTHQQFLRTRPTLDPDNKIIGYHKPCISCGHKRPIRFLTNNTIIGMLNRKIDLSSDPNIDLEKFKRRPRKIIEDRYRV